MLRQEFSKSYKKLKIHYTEQVRTLAFVASILDRHLVCTPGPEIMTHIDFDLFC